LLLAGGASEVLISGFVWLPAVNFEVFIARRGGFS
jgi:hypothetical protein